MTLADQLILLVEDEDYLAKMYQVEFELNDFKVIVAHDGKEAFDLVNTLTPNLIVADIMIPKMDGLTLLKKLKEDPNTKNIPVMILTNYGEQKNMKEAFAYGASDFVVKYFATPKEVVDKCRAILEKANARNKTNVV